MRYNPPPNWPAPPPGWQPPPGWEPDPAWGPAPQGWPVWLAEATPGRKPQRDRARLVLILATAVVLLACVGGLVYYLKFSGPDAGDTAAVSTAINNLAAASNVKNEGQLKDAMCTDTSDSVLQSMLTQQDAITIDSVTGVKISGRSASAQVTYHLGTNTSELKRTADLKWQSHWRVCALAVSTQN
jgi:hypothetical protein